VTVVDIRWIAG